LAAFGLERLLDRARDRAERGLVQHDVDAARRLGAVLARGHAAFHEAEALEACRAHGRPHLVEVALLAGREVVEPGHRLVELEQRLEQRGADESGDAGDRASAWGLARSSSRTWS
jgi:hypothetical protein